MLKRLINYLAPHRRAMVGLAAAMLAGAAIEMLIPWPLKVVVDNVLGDRPIFGRIISDEVKAVVLVLMALAIVGLAGARGWLSFLRNRLLAAVSQKAGLAMRSDLYSQVLRLTLRFHERSRVGDMVTRITSDVDELQKAFVDGLSLFAMETVTLIGIAVIMFWIDWQFALASLIVLPPLFWIYANFRNKIKEASRVVRSREGAMASFAQEGLSSIRLVKAFGQEEREQERFVEPARSKVAASIQVASLDGIFSFWVEVATAAGIGIILGYGGYRVLNGQLTLGEMLVFMQYLVTLYNPMRRLSRLTTLVQKAGASAERIFELFQAAPEVPEMLKAATVTRARGHIVFQRVSFGYEPGNPVLKEIDLNIRAGEAIAVVGPSGAGKSTLVSLIPRFYDPVRGRIRLDGKDLRELNLHSLRNQISIILQDPMLFSGTIAENIAYGHPEAGEGEIVEAAKAANIHSFISELRDGYDSEVGERGVSLSGGQRQRIAIARALIKDSPILILDEPTSSVDVESEGMIMEALARLIEGRTVIIIAHRRSATRLAGRVVVLNEGQIVEEGTAAELQAKGSFYRKLYALTEDGESSKIRRLHPYTPARSGRSALRPSRYRSGGRS